MSTFDPAFRQPNKWQKALALLKNRTFVVMLLLGFGSGLPFMLVGNTMGFWLREQGTDLTTIGFVSWVGFAYSMKFLWSPIVDRVKLPFLNPRLGHRRSWLMLSQILIAASLLLMGLVTPNQLPLFIGCALIAAFASATQDIVVDAWRIESSEQSEQLALLSSAYQLGYRAALLITDALILIVAAGIGWQLSYELMAVLMLIAIAATLMAKEPLSQPKADDAPAQLSLLTPQGFFDAVVGPFVQFFKTHGKWALVMLLAISLYRLPDFVMGPMNNPFYVDLGISKEVVGTVRGSAGLIAGVVGIAFAGLFAVRFGFKSTLILGAILGPGSNLAFAWLAHVGADTTAFTIAMVIDNFATGFAGTALVGYMSSLTSLGYTATQYALLSSFYALLGKFLKGFSGYWVDHLKLSYPVMEAYAWFFVGTALVGVPAVILCLLLTKQKSKTKSDSM